MNLHAQPRPPKWPFLAGDAALLAAAACIAYFEAPAFSTSALTLIFGCVALGAVLAVLPFILDSVAAQRQSEADLQARLEAQTHRLNHAAEILTGAAGQLKSAHEAASRLLHSAETLPYRMQEKIAEFTNQMQETGDEEKEAMEKELDALRETEGERLSAMADKIRVATREFQAVEKEARPALEAAVRQCREIEQTLTAAIRHAEAALAKAEKGIHSTLASTEERTRGAVEAAARADEALAARIAELRRLQAELDSALARRIEQLSTATRTSESAAPARQPRQDVEKSATVRRDPPAAETTATPASASPATPTTPITHLTAFPRPKPEPEPAAALAEPPQRPAPPEAAPPVKREPRRKASSRNFGDSALPGFGDHEVVYDEAPAPSPSAPAKTSDGSTRLLVTAYIGIGNKVFLRGDGPGLSPDKGVPMEFVSIGKWSWQTTEATAPLSVQLFKNDETRALGDSITLPPGHHVEIAPVFREPDPF